MALRTLKTMSLPIHSALESLESRVSTLEKETQSFLELFKTGPTGNYPNFSSEDYRSKLVLINYGIHFIGVSFSHIAAIASKAHYGTVLLKLEEAMIRINKQYQIIATAYANVPNIILTPTILDSVKARFQSLQNPTQLLTALSHYSKGHADILDAQNPTPKKPGFFSETKQSAESQPYFENPDEFLLSILKDIKNFRAAVMEDKLNGVSENSKRRLMRLE